MFWLIFFAFILVIIYKYVLNNNNNKRPEGFDGIPFISGLPVAWAYLRQRNYDEIGDLIHKLSGGHGLYFVCHMIHATVIYFRIFLKKKK
jgi:hypothetical protein